MLQWAKRLLIQKKITFFLTDVVMEAEDFS